MSEWRTHTPYGGSPHIKYPGRDSGMKLPNPLKGACGPTVGSDPNPLEQTLCYGYSHPEVRRMHSIEYDLRKNMGGCQNYGPFLGL